MKKILMLMLIAVSISGCADVTNVYDCLPPEPYGFFGGLWHGLIAGFSWLGSLFCDDIAIYAINNNGGWYDFGFILGVGGLSSSITYRK